MLPGPGHGRQAGDRVHVGRPVAAAREPVAGADERPFGIAIEAGELLDLFDRQAGDSGGPGRAARLQMRLQSLRTIGKPRHVDTIGPVFPESDVHHRAGQGAIGAGPRRQMQVGRCRRRGAIRVDDDQLGATLLPGAGDMGHDVDLGGDRVAAPDHDQVGFGHLPRVDAALHADPGGPTDFGQGRADRHLLARVAHHVAQPVDAVALHQAHRAGEIEWPNRLGTMPSGDVGEIGGDAVEGLVPADPAELGGPAGTGAQQRMRQPVGVVDPFGIARDLGADHAGGVAVVLRPAHRADAAAVQHLHRQSTGRRAVMRADRGPDFTLVHAGCASCRGT